MHRRREDPHNTLSRMNMKRSGGPDDDSSQCPLITFYVGGQRIAVHRDTIMAGPSPMLKRMIDGTVTPGYRMPEDGSIFLEEDPCVFKNILHIVRTSQFPPTPLYGVGERVLRQRLGYYGMFYSSESDDDDGRSLRPGKSMWISPLLPLARKLDDSTNAVLYAVLYSGVASVSSAIRTRISKQEQTIRNEIGGSFYASGEFWHVNCMRSLCIPEMFTVFVNTARDDATRAWISKSVVEAAIEMTGEGSFPRHLKHLTRMAARSIYMAEAHVNARIVLDMLANKITVVVGARTKRSQLLQYAAQKHGVSLKHPMWMFDES